MRIELVSQDGKPDSKADSVPLLIPCAFPGPGGQASRTSQGYCHGKRHRHRGHRRNLLPETARGWRRHHGGLAGAGATPSGRKELAEKTGIGDRLILKWVNRADLFRVKGIGEQYSDLLAEAGVETVLELAQRRADHLHQKLTETNEAKNLVRVVPGPEQVAEWVEQAHKLPRVVSY